MRKPRNPHHLFVSSRDPDGACEGTPANGEEPRAPAISSTSELSAVWTWPAGGCCINMLPGGEVAP